MNLNHDPDKHLLDQIDKLLESGQLSDDALLNELATTRPKPRTAFQNTLEERLLARLERLQQGEAPMVNTSPYMTVPAPRRNWLPLTLVVALIVVAIAGVMLINGRGKSNTPNEMALAAATATVTQTTVPTISNAALSTYLPPSQVAISIPLAHLSSDSLLPGGGAEVDIAALLSVKATNPNLDVLPATIMPDGSQTVEIMLIHSSTVIFHSAVSPSNPADASASITFAVSRDDSRLLAWLGEQSDVRFRLQKSVSNINAPIASVPVDFSMSFVTADEPIQAGDRVDIVSICAFVPDTLGNSAATSKTDCSQATNDKRALNVLVTGGEIVVDGQPPVTTNNSIWLAVPQDSLPMFAQMMDARMHFKLVKSGAVSQPAPTITPTPLPTSVPLASGKVAVKIPLASITTIQSGNGLQAGDKVDVIATVLFAEIGDKIPGEFQQMITPQPVQPDGTLTQRVVQAARVVNVDDGLTLELSPDQEKVIQWLVSAKLPIILRPVDSATTSAPTSPDALQLPLDSGSHWASDDIQVGDTVDVVMGFVWGGGDSISLDFKPYATYDWVDDLSKGQVSYQIYAPTNGKPGAGAVFIHRIVQNAVVTAIKTYIDPASGRMSTLDVTIELASPPSSAALSEIKGFIDAGMPYLVVKH